MAAFAAVPAVGAESFLWQADGLDKIGKLLEFERGEVKAFADALDHSGVLWCLRICVGCQICVLVAFKLAVLIIVSDQMEAQRFEPLGGVLELGLDIEEVARRTTANSDRLFGCLFS